MSFRYVQHCLLMFTHDNSPFITFIDKTYDRIYKKLLWIYNNKQKLKSVILIILIVSYNNFLNFSDTISI